MRALFETMNSLLQFNDIPEDDRCQALFLLSCLQRVTSFDVEAGQTLDIGLKVVMIESSMIESPLVWERVEMILTKKESRTYNTVGHNRFFEYKNGLETTVEQFDFVLGANMKDVAAILNLCKSLQESVLCFWITLRRPGEMRSVLGELLGCITSIFGGIAVPLIFDEDYFLLPTEAAKIELFFQVSLWAFIVFPSVKVDAGLVLEATRGFASTWYTHVRVHRKENPQAYEKLLTIMALVDRLSPADFLDARDEMLPGIMLAKVGSEYKMPDTQCTTHTECLQSCLRWLFLDAQMAPKIAERSMTPRTSRRRKADVATYNEEEAANAVTLNFSKFGAVYIAPSQISMTQNTGNGVFAGRNFDKNDVISEYCGTYYKGNSRRPKISPYLRAYETNEDRYIDGDPNIDNLDGYKVAQIIQDPMDAKYCNSINIRLPSNELPLEIQRAVCVTRPPTKKGESKLDTTHDRLMQIATRHIPKGTEIYTSYRYSEKEYGNFHMQPKEPKTVGLQAPKPTKIFASSFL